jgi:hypothetical protein
LDTPVLAVDLKSLREAKSPTLVFLLELRKVGSLLKEVRVRTLKIFEACCNACAGTSDRNGCSIFQLGSKAQSLA